MTHRFGGALPRGEEMSGPQDDLNRVIDALTAATQALTQATLVLRKVSAEIGAEGEGAGGSVTPPPSMISTWEDDPFSEAALTSNPPVSALIDQTVTAPSPNTGLSWQVAGDRPAAGQHQPGSRSSGTGWCRNPAPCRSLP